MKESRRDIKRTFRVPALNKEPAQSDVHAMLVPQPSQQRVPELVATFRHSRVASTQSRRKCNVLRSADSFRAHAVR